MMNTRKQLDEVIMMRFDNMQGQLDALKKMIEADHEMVMILCKALSLYSNEEEDKEWQKEQKKQ